MVSSIGRWGLWWVRLNGVLFGGYALFGMVSLVWPARLPGFWFPPMHLATLAVNLWIVYALLKQRFRINYVVVFVSAMMIGHLLIFIFSPLGMALAYIGPSRSFYALFLAVLTRFAGERVLPMALLAFNLLMLLVHLANIWYFSRRKVAAGFYPTPSVATGV